MTGKCKIGKTFPGICTYISREDKQAQVLLASGVRTDSASHMAEDFDFQRALRPSLGNAVLHVALSLAPEDAAGRTREELSQLLREIGQAYVKEMKLENTQWVLVQHFDRPHPHAHLVVNRVDNDGHTVPDNFIGKQSREVCQQLERTFKLTIAEQQGRDQARSAGLTRKQEAAETPKQRRMADWQRARHETANALRPVAGYVGSWEALQKYVAPKGVLVIPSTHLDKNNRWRAGVIFEKDGFRFKGGEVGPEYRADRLERQFATYRRQVGKLTAEVTKSERAYVSGSLADRSRRQQEAAQQQEAARQAKAIKQAARRQVPRPAPTLPAVSRAELEL